jgi:5'-deoxynucleotidase YfbR-like HD superfamily hydrolase
MEELRRLCTALSDVKRRGWLEKGIPRGACESVADHSHAMALYCVLYAPKVSG